MPHDASRGRIIDLALGCLMTGAVLGLSLPWLVALLSPAMPDAGTLVWLLDLATHWQLMFAAAWALPFAAWWLRCPRARLRWLPAVALAALPWASASPALPAAAPSAPATLSLAVANVHVGNRDPAPLLQWLAQSPADVLVVPELSPAYAAALDQPLSGHPHRHLLPRADSAFGIGLYSRRPLRDVVLVPDARGIPAVGATLDVQGRPVRLIAVHPMPPVAPAEHAARDRLLAALAAGHHPALGGAPGLPLLVAGDLNATPWSSALRQAPGGRLRRTTGFGATWPMSWGGYLGIPIDHVLASAEWRVVDARRGPGIGSDHAPIRVELRLDESAR